MKFVIFAVAAAFLSSCASLSGHPEVRTTASTKKRPTPKPIVIEETAQQKAEHPAQIQCHDGNGSGLSDFRIKYVETPIIKAVTPSVDQANATGAPKKEDGQFQIFAGGGQYTYSAHPDKKGYAITMSDVGFDHFIKAISTTASSPYKTDQAPTDVRFSDTPKDDYPAQLSFKFQDSTNNLSFGCDRLGVVHEAPAAPTDGEPVPENPAN